MVTASRDSTVKVWEADWQIRMVFVGHTGPVTCLAVLPNSGLLLSASQDGTLRTWDLQAAAQVGEVALSYWGHDGPSGLVSSLLAPASTGWPVMSLRASSVELWRLSELYSLLAQLSAPILHLQVAPTLPTPLDPPLPTRLVCACADGSVYLVSVATGKTVSALLLEPEDRAAAVAYCLPWEALWLLTCAGHLVCANAARCPMRVLHRVPAPPPPAPRPCSLHLYSHLRDASSARASWEMAHRPRGELCLGDKAGPWEDKNRFLPVVGHTDGALSVLGGRSPKPVFRVEAHGPGPVTAIASTRSSVVSSGGDLTVKVWRVFPYAEESLSLLCTFASCHPATMLCALGPRVTVAFEDPDSATYGLAQFSLDRGPRCDHRPQDDPTDHITGLCCCPALKLCASAGLDCAVRIWTAENRLLRLLQLNGAPQALTFCSNAGDLVLAIGSRLCLVSHWLYLPTSYLVKKLHEEVPEVVDDPPLPLTGQESLPPAQLQRLAHLHGAASLSTALPLAHRRMVPRCPPVLEEDLKALMARDHDLQQLRWSLLTPKARGPLSGEQHREAFENYLYLIYGPGLLGMHAGGEPHQGSSVDLVGETGTWNVHPVSRAALSLRQSSPPTYQPVHSQASQLLARSSLSSCLGLSLDLQLREERHRGRTYTVPEPPATQLQHRVPLLLKRRPQEQLSQLRGFFPATIESYECSRPPICFPSYVPNSVVLQRMWPQGKVSGQGALTELASRQESKKRSEDSLWLPLHRRHTRKWPLKLIPRAQAWEEQYLSWSSGSQSPPSQLSDLLESLEPETPPSELLVESFPERQGPHDKVAVETHFPPRRLLRQNRFRHLPSFLHFFAIQNWFKKLFPIFTLKMYPEGATPGGLASLFLDLLEGVPWTERVHILWALLRLMPDLSRQLCSRLQDILMRLLNLDQYPSLQDPTQRQFVILALQLLLACSLDASEVVLELMAYFLCSPASSWFELKKLLDGLGLKDPQGFLFKEMMSWVQAHDIRSKASLRRCCRQKLEDMMTRHLKVQMELLSPSTARLSDMLAQVSQPLALPAPPKETLSQMSVVSGTPVHILVTPSVHSGTPLSIAWRSPIVGSPGEPDLATPEPQAEQLVLALRRWATRHRLSEVLLPFSALPGVLLRASAPAVLPGRAPLPLERTEWSRAQWVDLSAIDALNFFCEQQRGQLWASLQEGPEGPGPPSDRDRGLRLPQTPKAVLPQPPQRRRHPIPRLQEGPAGRRAGRPSGQRRPEDAWRADRPLRELKLPLPRVDLRPFPPDWPRPARPRPPRPLQPALQRYFVPARATPGPASAARPGAGRE